MVPWILVFILSFLLAGCGKKGPPRAPEEVRPERPQNLKIKLNPLFAEISFKIPLEDVRGQALTKLKAFWIEKRRYPPENPSLVLTQIIKVPFQGKLDEERNFYWRDRNLRPGFCYEYRISAVKGFRSRSDWSIPQKFCWTTPPQTPKGFEVKTLLPHQVFLHWEPVTRNIADFPLPSSPLYRIWRRSPKATRTFPPIPDTAFYDQTVKPGETYCYSIEPLLPYYGTLVPGFKTPEICVRP